MAKIKGVTKNNTSLDKARTWWLKGHQDYVFVMHELMNIGFPMLDNPSTDDRTSYVTGPPQFTMIEKGKLVHHNLERADVDEHYEEIEEQIWAYKNDY